MIASAKYKDMSWDFRKSNTKEYTHCFHNYPAMMIPQVARKLLERYGVPGGWLLDPYCGTGTSMVEASLFGMNAIGCDINPLVRLTDTTSVCQNHTPFFKHPGQVPRIFAEHTYTGYLH